MGTIDSVFAEFAPAKINLTLHVTGQREDGYHLLDSLVAFVDVGDRVTVRPASTSRLTVDGPMAQDVPTDSRNLVLRAAALTGVNADIHLHKCLPAAAGIGGGSSDAAATLRAIARMADRPLPSIDALTTLGADVPVCMRPGLTRMQGIGEKLGHIEDLPRQPVLLVNPGVSVPTPTVFKALGRKNNPPMNWPAPDTGDKVAWLAWLATQRNDLQAPAIQAEPVIGTVLDHLAEQPGCLLARMSGSGATCFAIFEDDEALETARARLKAEQPNWWIAATRFLARPSP